MKEAESKAEGRIKTAKNAQSKAEGQLKDLKEALSKVERRVVDLKADRDQLETAKKDLADKVSSLEGEKKSLEENIKKLEVDNKALLDKVKNLQEKRPEPAVECTLRKALNVAVAQVEEYKKELATILDVTIAACGDSFDDAVDQVEYFHKPLKVVRSKVFLGQKAHKSKLAETSAKDSGVHPKQV